METDSQQIDISVSYASGERAASGPESARSSPVGMTASGSAHAVGARYGLSSVRPDRVFASMEGVGRFVSRDGQRAAPRAARPPVRQAPPPKAPSDTGTAPPAGASGIAVPAADPVPAPPPPASPPRVSDPGTDPAAGPRAEPLLSLEHVTKAFGDVRAVDDVSLALRPGEKHALLGENGAGKSTLVKMIYGVLHPDAGTIRLDGEPVRIDGPSAARGQGIGMVFQHFSTFEALSVAENLAVVLPDRSLRAIRRDVRRIGGEYGLGVEPDRRLASLSAGERQRVEIIRCLLQNPRLLIMDEPTSVLTPQEAAALFVVLDRLAAEGCAILYISHRLDDVRVLCESATVMRRGKVVATCNPREESAASLAEMMIGSTVTRPRKQASFVGGALLRVEGLTVPSVNGGVALDDVTFSARKGEILGIAGIAGEGQPELFAALSGERPSRRHKAVSIDGRPVGRFDPTRRRRAGMAFAPERRIGHSAIGDMRLSENYRLTHHATGAGGGGAMRGKAAAIRETYDVRANGRDPFASALSGGNLQKFVIGREIARDPKVLIVEQPTWGVDAGAAAAIHEALMALAVKGAAVVVISQDLDEIFALCDRVAVLHRGTLSEPRVTDTVTAEDLGLLMGGATPEKAEAEASDSSMAGMF